MLKVTLVRLVLKVLREILELQVQQELKEIQGIPVRKVLKEILGIVEQLVLQAQLDLKVIRVLVVMRKQVGNCLSMK